MIQNQDYRGKRTHETKQSKIRSCKEKKAKDACAATDKVEEEQEDFAKVWNHAVLGVHVDGEEAKENPDHREDG